MTRLRSTGLNPRLAAPLLALTAGLWSACAAGAVYNVGGPEPDFDSIGQAVNSSAPGDTIVVHPGEYYENLFIPHDLTLTSTDPSDDETVAATIIDGSQEAPVIQLNPELSDQALITGLTIRNGHAQFYGEGGQTGGGGISGGGSLARIERNIILGNVAETDPLYGGGLGGGLFECNGTILGNQIVANQASRGEASYGGDGGGLAFCHGLITDNIISENSADGDGGGLFDCNGEIRNNIIQANTSGENGGGLAACAGVIDNNAIATNSAGTNGGGLWDCDAEITDNDIVSNTAGSDGGGIYYEGVVGGTSASSLVASGDLGVAAIEEGAMLLQGGLVLGNTATYSGGGLYGGEFADQVTGVRFERNTAEFGGAAAASASSFENCVFWANEAFTGGATYEVQSLANCTFYQNTAGSAGGAVYGYNVVLRNSIIWSNTPSDDQISDDGVEGAVEYCCIQPGAWPGGAGQNGIADPPSFISGATGDFRLQPKSPCIDAGSAPAPAEDIEGIARPYDGSSDPSRGDGSDNDIGAHEYNGPITHQILSSVTGSGSIFIKAQGTSGLGSPLPPEDVYPEDAYVLTAEPNEGWQFLQWELDLEGVTTAAADLLLDSAKSVRAVFAQAFELILSVVGEGAIDADPPSATGLYDPETVVTLNAVPAAGWDFRQWQGDATGTENPIGIVMDADKAVTAVFEQLPAKLTMSHTGSGTTTPASGGAYEYEVGSVVQISATPDEGWEFVRWEGDATGSQNPLNLSMDADKTVTAVFEQLPVQLTMGRTGSGTTTPASGGVYEYEVGSVVQISATPDEGWEFVRWEGDATGSQNPLDLSMDADKTVTAVFERMARLTIEQVGPGAVSPASGQTHYFAPGAQVEVTATPEEGHLFTGWSGDAAGTENPIVVTMDADKTITATFQRLVHLTVEKTGSGSVVPQDGLTHPYVEGVIAVLTATPDPGWRFDRWEGAATGDQNPLSLPMDGDKTVRAVFEPTTVVLTMATTGSGDVSPTVGDHVYGFGATVELRATPAPGWRFDRWEGDATGSENPTVIEMDAPKSVRAVFIQTYALTVATVGAGATAPAEGTHVFDAGAEVTLTATPATDWLFDQWTGDATGANPSVTVVMDRDRSVTALFSAPADAATTYYVSVDGDDANDGTTPQTALRSVQKAVGFGHRAAPDGLRSTVIIGEGVFELPETLEVWEQVNLIGQGPGLTTLRVAPDAASPEYVAVRLGPKSNLENVTVELPADVVGPAVLVDMGQWNRIGLLNCFLDGSPNAGTADSIGVRVTGGLVYEAIIAENEIAFVHTGILAIDSAANITRNFIHDIYGDAVVVRTAAKRAAGAKDQTQDTPLLGDAEDIEDTGLNQFRDADGLLLKNETDGQVLAQMNDWGLYELDDINDHVEGPTDNYPYIGKSIGPGFVVVDVVDAGNARIGADAEPTCSIPALGATGERDPVSEQFIFPNVPEGSHLIQATAKGFSGGSATVQVSALNTTPAKIRLTTAGGGGGGCGKAGKAAYACSFLFVWGADRLYRRRRRGPRKD